MEETTSVMAPEERVKRFWTAHGRTADVATVLIAFRNNRTTPLTPEHLCIWYGVPVDQARSITRELQADGIFQRADLSGEAYVWNPELDWVGPLDDATWRGVEERQASRRRRRPREGGTALGPDTEIREATAPAGRRPMWK